MDNPRRLRTYTRALRTHDVTRPMQALIGMRRKPRAEGHPGWIRVDSVHQGDPDKV